MFTSPSPTPAAAAIPHTIAYADFEKIDIRVGTIIKAQPNQKARIPAYELDIDFGPAIGIKKSSAQITQNYQTEQLIGKQICAVVNFSPRRVANVLSEVLVLGIVCQNQGVVLLEPNLRVENGGRMA